MRGIRVLLEVAVAQQLLCRQGVVKPLYRDTVVSIVESVAVNAK